MFWSHTCILYSIVIIQTHTHCYLHSVLWTTVWLDDFSCDHCIVNHFLIVPPVCPLLIASSILSNVYIFHENMYLQNLRSPLLHVQKSKFSLYLSFFLYKYKNNMSSKNKSIEFSPKCKYYKISIMTGFKYCDAKKEKIPKG
jgi:hypothetical protein